MCALGFQASLASLDPYSTVLIKNYQMSFIDDLTEIIEPYIMLTYLQLLMSLMNL